MDLRAVRREARRVARVQYRRHRRELLLQARTLLGLPPVRTWREEVAGALPLYALEVLGGRGGGFFGEPGEGRPGSTALRSPYHSAPKKDIKGSIGVGGEVWGIFFPAVST